MNLYEHTIVARQDTSPSQITLLTEKYSKIVEKNESLDKKLLRYLTVKVKKFDLDTNYFSAKKEDIEKRAESKN